jgi:hypothetical protein
MVKNEEKSEEESADDSVEESSSELDLSSLPPEEQDRLILEMQTEEIMEKRKLKRKKPSSSRAKNLRLRSKKEKKQSPKNIAPGFGWVAIKMGSAMTFSMVFIFLGPIMIFMAFFKAFGERGVYDWYDLLFGLIGVGLVVASYFLFRYITSD